MIVDFLNKYSTEEQYNVSNLAYRKNGKIISNPLRPPEDLAHLPRFPWHVFPRRSISPTKKSFLYVTASRGCPFNCTYCSNGIYLKHYGKQYLRFRPVPQIIDELLFLKKTYAPPLFYFGDEMILSKPEYAIELFESVKMHVNVPYGIMCRVEYVTIDLAKILKNSSCQYVAMGIECGDEEFRKKYLNRNMTNLQIENAFSIIKQAGIFTASFNMMGFPFPQDDLLTEKTIELNKKIAPNFVQISIFYPFPGTKLFKHCIDTDLIDPIKAFDVNNLYSESILKGTFVKDRCNKLSKLFNPNGFDETFNIFMNKGNISIKYYAKLKKLILSIPFFRMLWQNIFKLVKFSVDKRSTL